MSELQKNIIENLLKEKKKTKRDLAKFLDIKENSINRTLKNPNISILKLEHIAEFLEIDISELLIKKYPSLAHESQGEYKLYQDENHNNQLALTNLSEVIKINSRTIEMMAETEKSNSKNIENLVKLITDKYSSDK
jgi:transcriptional regulator with XRE-family HTH domain